MIGSDSDMYLTLQHKKASAILVCLTILLSALSTLSQERDDYLPPTKAEWEELQRRTNRIKEEVARNGMPAWTGKYDSGGSIPLSGAILIVAPKSGFIFRPYTDYSPNNIEELFDYGDVEEKNGVIYLRSVRKLAGKESLHFVRWGDRALLIAENEVPTLANYVNAGCWEFQSDRSILNLRFFTKKEDVRKKVFGRPSVSRAIDPLLLSSELTAKVVEIGDKQIKKDSSANSWSVRRTTVTLNVGTRDGVWVGMRMYGPLTGPSSGDSFVDIKSVYEFSAQGEMAEAFNGKEPGLPSIGLEFTTKLKAEWTNRMAWDCY